MNDRIFVTKADFEKLEHLLGRRQFSSADRATLDTLEHELDRAEIVDSANIRPDVVTMNSEVRLRDLDSGERLRYKLVFPNQVRAENDISVLAPVGTALLGYSAGDVIKWPVPRGIRHLQILEVVYQPEAAELPVSS